MPIKKPKQSHRGHHLCADKAYDADSIRRQAARLGYRVHIPKCTANANSDPGVSRAPHVSKRKRHSARRWRVEPTLSWQNNFRSPRTRWLKKEANWLGLNLLASSLIVFRTAFYE